MPSTQTSMSSQPFVGALGVRCGLIGGTVYGLLFGAISAFSIKSPISDDMFGILAVTGVAVIAAGFLGGIVGCLTAVILRWILGRRSELRRRGAVWVSVAFSMAAVVLFALPFIVLSTIQGETRQGTQEAYPLIGFFYLLPSLIYVVTSAICTRLYYYPYFPSRRPRFERLSR